MLKMSDLASMKEHERDAALGRLADHARAKPNGGLTAIELRIREYEARYEMTSERMRKLVASDPSKETAELGKWLMLLSVRDRVK